MSNSLWMILFFLVIGVGWRFVSPQGVGAAAMQRHLMLLARVVILPVAIFFILYKMPLHKTEMKIFWYVVGTTAIVLGVAWVWLWKSRLAPRTKGALLIAAGFGNTLFLGLPLNRILTGGWSMRIAAEYGMLANVLLLFTAGAILSRSFTDNGGYRFKGPMNAVLKDYSVWWKEPLVWAAAAGLIANISAMKFPGWFFTIEAANNGFVVPLLLLSTALAVSWNDSWKTQWQTALPAAGIQLVLAPLVMWGMVRLFGSIGTKGTQALLLNSMMPAAVFGFVVCERNKLDTGMYALAFSLTSVLALLTVPVWFKVAF